MRISVDPFPHSAAVLESHLKAAIHWLEAAGPLHGDAMEPIDLSIMPHVVREMDDWLFRLIRKFRREKPLDGGFWEYVDWPFAWDRSASPEEAQRDFRRAFGAAVDRFGYLASPMQVMVPTVQAFVREVRARLEGLARRPAIEGAEAGEAAPDGKRPAVVLRGKDKPPLIRGVPWERNLSLPQLQGDQGLVRSLGLPDRGRAGQEERCPGGKEHDQQPTQEVSGLEGRRPDVGRGEARLSHKRLVKRAPACGNCAPACNCFRGSTANY
jgi:hypothetical protein